MKNKPSSRLSVLPLAVAFDDSASIDHTVLHTYVQLCVFAFHIVCVCFRHARMIALLNLVSLPKYIASNTWQTEQAPRKSTGLKRKHLAKPIPTLAFWKSISVCINPTATTRSSLFENTYYKFQGPNETFTTFTTCPGSSVLPLNGIMGVGLVVIYQIPAIWVKSKVYNLSLKKPKSCFRSKVGCWVAVS